MGARRGDRRGYQPGDLWLMYMDYWVMCKAMPLLIVLAPLWLLFALCWWCLKYFVILFVVWPARFCWWLLGKFFDGAEVVLRWLDRRFLSRD